MGRKDVKMDELDLKKGDKVIYFFDKMASVETVEKITPKGFIKVEGFDKPFIKYKEPNFAKIKAEYLAKKIENDGRVY